MRSRADRIRQAVSFEVIGVVIATPLFSWVFGHTLEEIGPLAVLGGTTAAFWNYLFNLGFDRILAYWRRDTRKTPALRLVHAVLFEASLLLILMPVFAWWLGISLHAALLMDLSFAAFYVAYTLVFTWSYDRLLPPPLLQESL